MQASKESNLNNHQHDLQRVVQTSFQKIAAAGSAMSLYLGGSFIVDRDVHEYGKRGRDNYRTGRHRTVVYEHLPSQVGVRFINSLPDSMKNVQTPKALKTRLKRFLASKAFYSVDEFFNYSWETSNLED
ncbi:hypothetical protein J6590_033977 [Homalodisca vitripennis]|nr:hypothetical protein J6590_033977 [Homalodisca vitripennis]